MNFFFRESAAVQTANSIKEYFNATLGSQLLYKYERIQYSEVLAKKCLFVTQSGKSRLFFQKNSQICGDSTDNILKVLIGRWCTYPAEGGFRAPKKRFLGYISSGLIVVRKHLNAIFFYTRFPAIFVWTFF